MKILVVEDEGTVQMVYQQLLLEWGYEFDLASNGEEAVELAQANNGAYDLCIMDVEMPVMNGTRAIQLIRERVEYFPILSCSTEPHYECACRAAGADDFFIKPCLPELLKAKITALTVKKLVLHLDGNSITLKSRKPANSRELQELRKYDSQGLARLVLVDASKRLLVHKRVGDKLMDDLLLGDQVSSEFIDYTPEEPGLVRVFASEVFARKSFVSRSQYERLAGKENRELG